VYFVFTNTSLTDDSPVAPSVTSDDSSVSAVFSRSVSSYDDLEEEEELDAMEKVRTFNNGSFDLDRDSSSRSAGVSETVSASSIVADDVTGDTKTFYLYSENDSDSSDDGDSVDATLQYHATVDDMNFSIWVADDCMSSTKSSSDEVKSSYVTDAMVTTLAEKFLDSSNDDIYKWVTDLYGDPWGENADSSTYSSYLISGDESDGITILLYDIPTSGYLGYYWSKDNFNNSYDSGSNERLIFYLDAVYFATKEGVSWDDTDYLPEYIISTLAHEFQHMINFYQKRVSNDLLNVSVETWLNEMCSLVTEDFVADKLETTNNPRGILGSDYESGNSTIDNSCRLNSFNPYNDESFLEWDSVYDYSTVYAFGAYLARNYGGAELFQKIVQNSEVDENAVINALSSLGYSKSVEDLLAEWGEYVLFSNEESEDGYNKSNDDSDNGEFESTVDGNSYSLGSFNLYNYINDLGDDETGPKIYEYNTSDDMEELEPGTNTYYLAGSDLESGTYSWTVELPSDVVVNYYTKDAE
jgi:hypothetical protein